MKRLKNSTSSGISYSKSIPGSGKLNEVKQIWESQVLFAFSIVHDTAPEKIYHLFHRYFLWWPEWFFSVCQKNFVWREECTVVLSKKKAVGQLL